MRKLSLLIMALGASLWAAPGGMPAAPAAVDTTIAVADTNKTAAAPMDPTKADPAKPDSAAVDPVDSTDLAAEDEPAEDTAGADSAKAPKRNPGARLFQSWELAGEGGIYMPMGRLGDIIDPAPVAGLRMATSYYGDWRAVAGISGGVLAGPGTDVALAVAAAGLEWRTGPSWLPKPGLGISLTYVRSTGEKEEEVEYLFMDDGESEFGIQSSLQWIIPAGPSLRIRAGGRYDMTFTEPVYSHALSFAAGAGWAW